MMKWTLAAVGRPRLAYARLGIDEYLGRLQHFAPVEFVTVKAGSASAESTTLLERTAGAYRIALDERGTSLGSSEFADRIRALQDGGTRRAAILIGGADGHSPTLRKHVDLVVSLSPFTLQHELATLVFLEQLYRAYTILGGLPYHRE